MIIPLVNNQKCVIRNFRFLSVMCFCVFPLIMLLPYGCVKQITKQEVTGIDGKPFFVELLSPKDAYDLIQKNKGNSDFVILDIRTPEEFSGGHIEGAVNIDFRSDTFADELNKLDHNKTYFVYCRTGNRSYDAVALMARFGFSSIVRLSDDITGWKSAKLPIVK